MSKEKSPNKIGSVKLEPMKGRFFDIAPAKSGKVVPALGDKSGYFRFAITAFVAFIVLSLGNAYVQGRDLVLSGQESAYAGYESIKQGMDSLKNQDGESASQFFAEAQDAFNELSINTRHLTMQANNFTSQNLYLDTANSLLESALKVADIGQELSILMQDLSALPKLVLEGKDGFDVITMVHEKGVDISFLLSNAASLQRSLTTLNSSLLPEILKDKIELAQYQIGTFIAALLEIEQNFDVLLTMLGDKVPHRYLILFQNNHERRATGGFIGSYMIVDVNDGKITKMEAKDVYESDGQLADFVKAPSGINQVADRLYMRDANYSPDFPTSAKEILWFLEHSKGPSADTVIAIDQSLVESIIDLTGPLILSSIPYQITSENFSDLISFHTEAKTTDSATPKQLLFDLIPAFKKHLGQLNDLGPLLAIGKKMIQEGHIQVYSNDIKIQDLSKKLGTSGELLVPADKTDYLAVITTSIGGNKSDQYMHMKLNHETEIAQDGGLVDELSISKTHAWGQEEERNLANMIERYGTGKLTKESLYFILGRGPNVDFMRVYVPLGSQIQDVQGVDLTDVEVTQDLGYTVFGFTFGPVNSGSSKTVSLRYKLPYDLKLDPVDNYRLIAQNQAGAENVEFIKKINISDYLTVLKTYPPSDSAFLLNPIVKQIFDQNLIFISSIEL